MLVARAGVEALPDLVKISEPELHKAIRINLLAPAALARTTLPPMIERGDV